MTDPALLHALELALAAAPGDTVLRGRYAALLNDAGRPADALAQAQQVLGQAPDDRAALAAAAAAAAALGDDARATAYRRLLDATGNPAAPTAPAQPAPPVPAPPTGDAPVGFDWFQAEADVADVEPVALPATGEEGLPPDDLIETPSVRLADVGGMKDVKQRLEAAFLAPMRNPELRKMYGKSLRGGLLLYGPPGCGKTFLARAVAGELGAGFMSIGLADVLDKWFGVSEQRLHELFEMARRNAPTVVFIDEIDAMGQRRTQLESSPMRAVVNQLLTELDGVNAANEGVFVLAASNAPWDVDPALKRPGRLDRLMLVLPPDEEARDTIVRTHLRDRPVGRVDVGRVVKRTDGFSGADLAYVCELAAEAALHASIASGKPRPIENGDLDGALRQVTPSTVAWFSVARNVVLFANEGRQYDDLLAYMRRARLA
ncbi:MAG TPA: ATP-binding protein [Frankiaceae bacterium]|nr:ATP-binding protein [Frankiaceae bacterium]